jgi:hypothetical protein
MRAHAAVNPSVCNLEETVFGKRTHRWHGT